MISMELLRDARCVLSPVINLTPMIPAKGFVPDCRFYLKADCLQKTGAFKLRGAMNKILALTEDERARGFVAASSGNHGRAVAYAAQRFGTHACIVMPETAPAVKQAAIRALGAELVLCDAAERFDVAARLCAERGATMVPPFDDPLVMAGQGTVGLEIFAQCPQNDAVVVPVSGGGLIGGVATAVKALAPHVRVYGAEPEALPRYRESLRAGHPVQVEQQRSVADALVAQRPGDVCFPYVAGNTDGFAPVATATDSAKTVVMADANDKSQAGASIPGMVSKVNVKPGDQVKVNDVLAVIEAMKMETSVVARMDGTVDEVFVKGGQSVKAGELLLTIK